MENEEGCDFLYKGRLIVSMSSNRTYCISYGSEVDKARWDAVGQIEIIELQAALI